MIDHPLGLQRLELLLELEILERQFLRVLSGGDVFDRGHVMPGLVGAVPY